MFATILTTITSLFSGSSIFNFIKMGAIGLGVIALIGAYLYIGYEQNQIKIAQDNQAELTLVVQQQKGAFDQYVAQTNKMILENKELQNRLINVEQNSVKITETISKLNVSATEDPSKLEKEINDLSKTINNQLHNVGR